MDDPDNEFYSNETYEERIERKKQDSKSALIFVIVFPIVCVLLVVYTVVMEHFHLSPGGGIVGIMFLGGLIWFCANAI